MRADIQEFIKNNRICVLATVDGIFPHCSLMSYATDTQCREIYMATKRNTKKYQNLIKNPSASLLIDSRETNREKSPDKSRALTITGTFYNDLAPEKKENVRRLLIEKHPYLSEFCSDRDVEIIAVKITALQLLDGITNVYFETVV